MSTIRPFIIGFLALLSFPISTSTLAKTWVVPVDALTIQAGLDSAVAGDTVSVQCGTYHENAIAMKAGAVLRSETGDPSCVTIDADSISLVLYFPGGGGPSTVVTGLTFTNGYGNNFGGAIQCWGASPTIANCVFDGNTAVQQGGAISLQSSDAVVADCVFVNNRADYSFAQGGAVYMYNCNASISNSFFLNNSSGRYGGALALSGSGSTSNYYTPQFTGCTFVGNTAANDASVVWVENWVSPSFDNVILAYNGGPGWIVCTPAPIPQAAFSCSNVYGNTNGDWTTCVGAQGGTNGNISADPMFCDAGAGNYYLDVESPCLAACGQMGAYGAGCGEEPEITGITDVPNDQGRQVRIKWKRAPYDAPGDTVDVDAYEVYRAQGSFMKIAPAEFPYRKRLPGPMAAEGWDFIVSVPAHGDSIYQVVAPTLCDSTIVQGQCWSSFYVRATTTDRFLYYDSMVDSGYSVDNLAPGAPPAFTVVYAQTGGNQLSWVQVPDEDFQYCRIYRGSLPDFVPSAGNLVHETANLDWLDAAGGPQDHYKISAVDHAGNEGESTGPNTMTGAGEVLPTRYVLYQNTPNPFNPTTLIHYDLPEPSVVTLRIYDVAGRLVRELRRGAAEPAGRYTVEWDGRNDNGREVATGVYFYRLRAGTYKATRRMVMLR